MRHLFISLIAILAVSCSQTKMFQKSISSYNIPIEYLHDSKKTNVSAIDSITIRLNNVPIDSITTVSKLKGLVLPFIVFNYSEVNMSVKLGQSSIEKPYDDFFLTSFIEESKRTGRFGIANQPKQDSTYTLDITIDTCSTLSKYRRSNTVIFLLFAYSMSFNEIGFPAETNLQVSTKLRKGDLVVAEKNYRITKTQPFLQSRNVSIEKLRSDFTANMVESLSLCTKQCIEDMIHDVNNSIRN